MGNRRALMVSGSYPCVRVGKVTEAMQGWDHDCLCLKAPPQFEDVYASIKAIRLGSYEEFGRALCESDAELIHVHNEPGWPVECAKRFTDKPVILNVHDVASARGHEFSQDAGGLFREEEQYRFADAFVFISEEQRRFAIKCGFEVEGKPYCVLPNYASHSTIVPYYRGVGTLPKIGGVVYAGGVDAKGTGMWRDLSPIAEAIELHIHPGQPGCNYGIVHPPILEYRLLTHRLAQFDWGFTGSPFPNEAWDHSYPNKVFEYMAAGIPFIAMNNKLLKPLAEKGYGIYVNNLRELKAAAKTDPKKYAARVAQDRHRYTMRYNIEPLQELYEEVLA